MIRAAIDVGSNSVLMTAERFENGQWQMVDETSAVTGLGTGVKTTGLLSPEPIKATLQAVSTAWNRAKRLGTDEIRAGGTMALRIAQNADGFLDLASNQNTPVTIITGEMEARLGFLSVANDPTFGANNRISIIDPGGHSTELVSAVRRDSNWNIEFQKSFPIGTLAMLSTVFQDECPDSWARFQACVELDRILDVDGIPQVPGETITLGATGTNLISIRERLATWQPDKVHGAYLDYEEIGKAVGWLSEMTLADRSQIVGMEPGRAGTLHAGALILERFLHAINADGCRVSVKGWRHAWLEMGFPDSIED